MDRTFFRASVAGLFLVLLTSLSYGFEVKTKHATIVYERDDLLRKFNKKVSMGSLSYLLRNKKIITVEDEAKNKLDVIIERVESVLDMFPQNLKFTVILLFSDKEVQRIYREKYGVRIDYISFYSPRDKTAYISVDDVSLGVLAHELAHVIMDHYFGMPPPAKVHEVLAQYVEKHLED
jgi:small-conductance mechanosensitive channel